MKKLLKLMLLIVTPVMLFTGCKGNKQPNAKRGTNYDFDIVNYLDIETFGEDGNGYLEVKVKDISSEDFASDEDYIAVKKDLDNIDPYVIPEYKASINVDKATNLSNGDIVHLSFPYRKEELNSNLNIEEYEYLVDNLEEAEEIDLFSEDVVTFFATETGQLSYHKKYGEYPDELVDMLRYTITTKDELEPDKAVLNIEASLDEEYLQERGFYSTAVYLAKNGYRGSTTAEKVLRVIVEPTDFSGINSGLVESALYDAIYNLEGDALTKIVNLQKNAKQVANEPYSYTVIYQAKADDKVRTFKRSLDIYYVDKEFSVENIGMADYISDDYLKNTIEGGQKIIDF